MWGVATAAYQIEGATQVDGRGISIWDNFAGKVANNENAEVTDLSYYKYLDDIKLIKSLGVKVCHDTFDYNACCFLQLLPPSSITPLLS